MTGKKSTEYTLRVAGLNSTGKGPRNVGGFQELEREGSGFSSECPEKSLAVLTPGFLPSEPYFELLTFRMTR